MIVHFPLLCPVSFLTILQLIHIYTFTSCRIIHQICSFIHQKCGYFRFFSLRCNPTQNQFPPVSRVFARISLPICAYPPALPDILQYLPDSYGYIPSNSPWLSRSVHKETPVCQMTYQPELPAYPWLPPFSKPVIFLIIQLLIIKTLPVITA